jgi:hypothetical protein
MGVPNEQQPEFASQLTDLRRVPLADLDTRNDLRLAEALQRVVPGLRDSPGVECVTVAAFNSYI